MNSGIIEPESRNVMAYFEKEEASVRNKSWMLMTGLCGAHVHSLHMTMVGRLGVSEPLGW